MKKLLALVTCLMLMLSCLSGTAMADSYKSKLLKTNIALPKQMSIVNEEKLTETEFVMGMITKEQLIEYTEQENEDRFLDMEQAEDRPMTDEEAKAVMLQLTGCGSAAEFQKLKKPEKDEFFRKLRQDGINISQIGRITGYSRQLIYRALEA